MSFYGRSNRALLEEELSKGRISKSQIVACDLERLTVGGIEWRETDIADLDASGMHCTSSNLSGSVFRQSNLMNATISACELDTMTFEGLTLIKSEWKETTVRNSRIRLCSLQRTRFIATTFIGTTLGDFEGINASVDRCLFTGSLFEITYGSGMNGFSGATIENCVFYNCRFDGFPLRGARIKDCVFSRCSGEIGDDMECDNVAGFLQNGFAPCLSLSNRPEAETLLATYGGINR